MHAIFTKGSHRVRITTSGSVVITDHDLGQGFQGPPFRKTVDDPEGLAQEYVEHYLAKGWTLTEMD